MVTYRDAQFEEMDLDAVLARRPELALVDELAHTNVPGSGAHEKRWQDVLELIDAGIAVITTVNVQHLESIADAVERMTGTRVRERVPDWVVRRADQLELIDSSPEALRRRMVHGNIYPAEKVPDALTHFFRTENLVALRELALRFVADETEEELLAYLRERHSECLVGDARADHGGGHRRPRYRRRDPPGGADRGPYQGGPARRARGVRRARRAGGADDALDVLHKLADDLGAEWHVLNRDEPARALVDFAREHQVTQIVLGSSRRSRWEELTKGSVVQRVLRFAADCDVDVHVIARRDVESIEGPEQSESARLSAAAGPATAASSRACPPSPPSSTRPALRPGPGGW